MEKAKQFWTPTDPMPAHMVPGSAWKELDKSLKQREPGQVNSISLHLGDAAPGGT